MRRSEEWLRRSHDEGICKGEGRDSAHPFAGCFARLATTHAPGASSIDELQEMLRGAGFINVRMALNEGSREFIREWGENLDQYIVSASIEAIKP